MTDITVDKTNLGLAILAMYVSGFVLGLIISGWFWP